MQENKSEDISLKIRAEKLLNDSTIPEEYVTGFIVNTTHSDGVIVFIRNGRPVLKMNMSFTNIKALSEKLDSIIKQFEDVTGMDIMTPDRIKQKFIERNANK